jgi:hypothetical protein
MLLRGLCDLHGTGYLDGSMAIYQEAWHMKEDVPPEKVCDDSLGVE